ncbi:hypothetical protein GQ457_01G010650 [Hibiscus cannabinus]
MWVVLGGSGVVSLGWSEDEVSCSGFVAIARRELSSPTGQAAAAVGGWTVTYFCGTRYCCRFNNTETRLSVLVSFGVGISSRSKDTILSFNMLFRVYMVLTSHFAEIFWWHTLLGYFFQAGFRVFQTALNIMKTN